jgi:Protein of unknown function (DUF1501)
MLSIYHTNSVRRISRREMLHVGGLSALGLGMGELSRLRAESADSRRKQNSCIFLFLFGGPSHIDLWDMKPDIPEQMRGEFRPRSTCVPGIQICEHLPLLARQMDKLCLLRSMTHRMNVHGPACSEVFSGRPYFGPPVTDQATRQDWPSLSSMMMRYGPKGNLPSSVVLPWYLQFPGQAKRIAGQTGGRMGEAHNALLIQGDFGKDDFEIQGLQAGEDMTAQRMQERRALLDSLLSPRRKQGTEKPLLALRAHEEAIHQHYDRAFALLEKNSGEAFNLRCEPRRLRERYGFTPVGQSLLLSRRLVEAGVPLVTVNWEDETKIDGVNTCWDTHQDAFPKMKKLLCPLFDQSFTAFIEDLHTRGLLESTLVVAIGEFGRTPKIGEVTQSNNTKKTGRDHWPNAFTAILAGGGVRGGQVYGATTATGGYVKGKPVSPADLTATILHHLGIDHEREYWDEFQLMPQRLSEGNVAKGLG